MKAGHATPGTNTALSDCLSEKTRRLLPLHFNVYCDNSHGVSTEISSPSSFSLHWPVCQGPFVQLEKEMLVCAGTVHIMCQSL